MIFFANDPGLPPEREGFPRRVIFLAAFDTGPKDKYWPGDFELDEKPPAGAWWRAARSVLRKDGKAQMVRVQIEPPRPAGARTRLRFRYYLRDASAMTVQIFDATAQDNRHLKVEGLSQGEWATQYVDFTGGSKRNDGTDSPFSAGNVVDDLFFFASEKATFWVDEVVLYDAR